MILFPRLLAECRKAVSVSLAEREPKNIFEQVYGRRETLNQEEYTEGSVVSEPH
jgi:hypothetical protein